MRILFILKFRDNKYDCDDYAYNNDVTPTGNPEGGFSTTPLSSGLFNSARFVQEMLDSQAGFSADIVHAVDNNDIDRLVTNFKPDVVIIEAYWVVPEKFDILSKLHPNITWVIRNHSAMPFVATDGVVVNWSLRYMDYPNVILSCNDFRTYDEFRHLVKSYKPNWSEKELNQRVVFLPNYYPSQFNDRGRLPDSPFLNVGCFGAIRPLKNQLIQAVAAIRFAEERGQSLRFHINGTRVENKGDPVMHNIRHMFELLPQHQLVEHYWLTHDKFIQLVRSMDVALQVSYTETFNIVTADCVVNGVPVVVSNEIPWVAARFHADPNNTHSIVKGMRKAIWFDKHMHFWQPSLTGLKEYDAASEMIWMDYLGDLYFRKSQQAQNKH